MAGIFDPAIFDGAIFDTSTTVVVRLSRGAVWSPVTDRRLASAVDERRAAETVDGRRAAAPLGGPPWQA